MSFDLLFDPLFRVPFFTGLLLAGLRRQHLTTRRRGSGCPFGFQGHIGDAGHMLGHPLAHRDLLRGRMGHLIGNLLDGCHPGGDPIQSLFRISRLLDTKTSLFLTERHDRCHFATATLQVIDHGLDLLGGAL